jgi:hypothetical protein
LTAQLLRHYNTHSVAEQDLLAMIMVGTQIGSQARTRGPKTQDEGQYLRVRIFARRCCIVLVAKAHCGSFYFVSLRRSSKSTEEHKIPSSLAVASNNK